MARRTTKWAIRYKTHLMLGAWHRRQEDRLRDKSDRAERKAGHHEYKATAEFDRLYYKWERKDK